MAKGYLNELETTGASSPVATNTGAAYVYGFPMWNTASVDTAIPTPSGNTRIDLVVLRANWSAQTVRITRIAGTEGAGAPSLTQTSGTTWDIPLAQASITTGGVITVTDTREFLHPNIAVDGNMLDADSVDDTKAGNRVPQFYRREGGSAIDWSVPGTTSRTPGAVRMQAGCIEWTGAAVVAATIEVTFPVAFSYAPLVFAICYGSGAGQHEINIVIRQPLASNVNLSWEDIEGGTHTSVEINWFAIGPE